MKKFKMIRLLFILLFTNCIYALDTTYDFKETSNFQIGPLEGAIGWSVYTGSTNSTQISEENPKQGLQYFRIINDSALFAGFPLGINSPILIDLQANQVSNVSLNIY